MIRQPPAAQDLVFIGGGHTHALVLRMWGMRPVQGVRLTVIDPAPNAYYTGMLPGYIAGHYRRPDLDIDLVRLAHFAGARLIQGAASRIDPAARRIWVEGREAPVAYDIASFDIGIHAGIAALPGFAEHGVSAKPLGRYATAWAAYLARISPDQTAPITVLGGGVAGVELALAMHHAVTAKSAHPKITIIDRSQILSGISPRSQHSLRACLDAAQIKVIEGRATTQITPDHITLDTGETIPSDFTLSAAGAQPYAWPGNALPHENGFLRVGPSLQIDGHANLFAVGDCAHLSYAPRPKAGVYAVRAAPILNANLRALILGGTLRKFHPQRDYLKLISLGKKRAMADRSGLRIQGALWWQLKDHIDRAFMRKFQDYPPMDSAPNGPIAKASQEAMDGKPPLCGGCGAKLAPAVLQNALNVESWADAAVLTCNSRQILASVDQLRLFWGDPFVMAQISMIHALGDIWAAGGTPRAVLPAITLPPLTQRLQTRMLAEINAGFAAALCGTGAQIIGGHSSEGPELQIGLTILGQPGPRPIGHGGAQPGDHLILTKPLGSGVIIAAHMAGQAHGQDVMAALGQMRQPQAIAAKILTPLAHAMTDVTGFGLAGHALNLARASDVCVHLWATAIQPLSGVKALIRAGVTPSLLQENLSFAGLNRSDEAALLADPQTAGGLLAAVPAREAPMVLAELTAAGYTAAEVGCVTDGPPSVECIDQGIPTAHTVK
jgi:selenide,water dikinase